MTQPPASPRKGKRLLVAALGVATVSFASGQGCGSDSGTERFTSGNLIPAPPLEAGAFPRDAALPEALPDAQAKDAGVLPPSGNLPPPPAPAPPKARHSP